MKAGHPGRPGERMDNTKHFFSISQDFWRNKRVLITGHTGFKGSWLSIWLTKLGSRVYGLSNETKEKSLFIRAKVGNMIERDLRADIRSIENLREQIEAVQPDVVFHLAAQPLVTEGYEKPILTWETNVLGTLNVLECLREGKNNCAIVIVTTDKVYENREWCYGYREDDPLGGHDPYSASKAATEICVGSWRSSFCGELDFQNDNLAIATARAGNVIGGGDWGQGRLIPDIINSFVNGTDLALRNPESIRPWQHVLDSLSGYLILAEKMTCNNEDQFYKNRYAQAFNFGPRLESNISVRDIVRMSKEFWGDSSSELKIDGQYHEAKSLKLSIDKSHSMLGWLPTWDIIQSVERTINWYKKTEMLGCNHIDCCLSDIEAHENKH